jgi:hypothetical protein
MQVHPLKLEIEIINIMKKITICFLFLVFVFKGFTQQVSGELKDNEGNPLAKSTISLLKEKDSAVVKLSVTGDGGTYSIQSVAPGSYRISASHIGFVTVYSAPFTVAENNIQVPALVAAKNASAMKEVTVTARKPLVEVKADKTILNVEGTINSIGSDALELLRKAPNVTVDKDDNISVGGKNGVQVYIDGRPTPLSAQDLANYLKSLHSTQIESIEIITNPSAKYEAAGNAGIINIRLKKDNSIGTNGSVNAGYAIGTYPKFSGGFSLNHRNKNFNVYASYNVNALKFTNISSNYRTILDSLFDQHSNVVGRTDAHNYKTGLDYYINKKQTVAVMLNGGFATIDVSTHSYTPISYIPTGQVQRILAAGGENHMSRKNLNTNFNYSYIDGTKKSLVLNADLGYYNIDGDQLQPNIYFDATGQNEIGRVIYNMLSPSVINLHSFKGDYEQDFKKGKLGFGAKFSWVTTTNDFQRYNVFTNTKELDKDRSNNFRYKENINALYVNYNRPFKGGWMIQAGLRGEQTTSRANSTGLKYVSSNYMPYDSVFTRTYVDLFPSAAITYNKDPMRQWTLTYSRRIDRPFYQDLNPFEYKLDEYTFAKGNTKLRPQYTNSIGLTFLFRQKLNTTLNYSHVNDIFSQLLDTTERSKVFQSKQNLATQDIVSLNLSYPYRHKNYSLFANSSTYYSKYKADFGPGRIVNLDVIAARLYVQNSLKFAKVWTAEITGSYSSPSIIQGTFKAKSLYSVDAGMLKQILKGKGSLKASVSDIFHTLHFSAKNIFAGQYLVTKSTGETRLFKLNFSYSFGNSQVKAARQRKTGLEEEAGRVQ